MSILGLPSNEFKGQEFSEDEDIAKFLDDRLGINQKDTPNLIIYPGRIFEMIVPFGLFKEHSTKKPIFERDGISQPHSL